MELKDLVQEVLGEIAKTENSDEKRQEQEAKVKEIQSIFTEDGEISKVLDAAEQAIERERAKNLEQQHQPISDEITPESLSETIDEIDADIPTTPVESDSYSNSYEEENFLSGLKERLLVIFEGFQSPNNQAVEAKLDLTLNFLEYLLARIENRLEEIESKK